MWISRKAYNDIWQSLVQAQATAVAEVAANKSLHVGLDWSRMRISQLERERAAMLERFYDIKIPVPQIVKAEDPFKDHPFNDLASMFNGMTDEEAATQGIGHTPAGELTFSK